MNVGASLALKFSFDTTKINLPVNNNHLNFYLIDQQLKIIIQNSKMVKQQIWMELALDI